MPMEAYFRAASAILKRRLTLILGVAIIVEVINIIVINTILSNSDRVSSTRGPLAHLQLPAEFRPTVNDKNGKSSRVTIAAKVNRVEGEGEHCLSMHYGEKMDSMIMNSKRVFITMPAKAAGSSLKRFTNKCMKQEIPDNFINNANLTKQFVMESFQLPSIITSHIYSGDGMMVDLVKHASRRTLIVHVHREETERLVSSIKEVLITHVCSKDRYNIGNKKLIPIKRNKTHCILNQGRVLQIIQSRVKEIEYGSLDILTCKTYEAIEQNAPNMILINYEQASKLQNLLAKHHCPELLDEPPYEVNAAAHKSREIYLRLMTKEGERIVKLDEWLQERNDMLEWVLNMKKDVSCQAKTRHMENDLFACPDQAIDVSSAGITYL